MAISKIVLNGTTQIDLTQDTVTAADMRNGVTAHGADGQQKTGNIQTVQQATPSVSVNNSTGLVTASATQTAGMVEAGTKSGTLQLATKGSQYYYPSTSDIYIQRYQWLTGNQILLGDPNFLASNIKAGVYLWGLEGTYSGGGGGTGLIQNSAMVVLDYQDDYRASWPLGLSVDMVRAVAIGIKPSYGADFLTVGPSAVYESGSGYEIDFHDGNNYLGTIILDEYEISTYMLNTNEDPVTLILFYEQSDEGGGIIADSVDPVSE